MRRHELDPVSLLPGLAFVALGAPFLFGSVSVLDLRWDVVWPVAVIVAGVVLLLSLRRGARPDEEAPPAAT